ncbi:MAG: hypothetical protein ACRD1K_03345 [Acidimicrobiales bacterium]
MGDRLYAVGTGQATAAVGGRPVSDLLVGWSDDAGRSFQRSRLPVDLAAVAARTTRFSVGESEVAAGPTGTVVVARLYAQLNLNGLLPAGATAPNGWATSATGVDLLGPGIPPPCPDPKGHVTEATLVAPEPPPMKGPAEVGPTRCPDPGAAPGGPRRDRLVHLGRTGGGRRPAGGRCWGSRSASSPRRAALRSSGSRLRPWVGPAAR